jgi:hypothetical protein
VAFSTPSDDEGGDTAAATPGTTADGAVSRGVDVAVAGVAAAIRAAIEVGADRAEVELASLLLPLPPLRNCLPKMPASASYAHAVSALRARAASTLYVHAASTSCTVMNKMEQLACMQAQSTQVRSQCVHRRR